MPASAVANRIDAGGFHSCGIRNNGKLACWGLNDNGQTVAPTGTYTHAERGLLPQLRAREQRQGGVLGRELRRPGHRADRRSSPPSPPGSSTPAASAPTAPPSAGAPTPRDRPPRRAARSPRSPRATSSTAVCGRTAPSPAGATTRTDRRPHSPERSPCSPPETSTSAVSAPTAASTAGATTPRAGDAGGRAAHLRRRRRRPHLRDPDHRHRGLLGRRLPRTRSSPPRRASSPPSPPAPSSTRCGLRADGLRRLLGSQPGHPPAGGQLQRAGDQRRGHQQLRRRHRRHARCAGGSGSDPVVNTEPAGEYLSVSHGSGHACAIRSDFNLRCWGSNTNGECDRTPAAGSPRSRPAAITPAASRPTTWSVCWGSNGSNQATRAQRPVPPGRRRLQPHLRHQDELRGRLLGQRRRRSGHAAERPVHPGLCRRRAHLRHQGRAAAPSAGARTRRRPDHRPGDALRRGQRRRRAHLRRHHEPAQLACWGGNTFGQSTPPCGRFLSVSAGDGHSCGVKSNGDAVCWGRNDVGQSDVPPWLRLTDRRGQSASSLDALRLEPLGTPWPPGPRPWRRTPRAGARAGSRTPPR